MIVKKPYLKKIGVVGAGMMGTGIAYTAALNGMNVTLIDKDIEVAKKGINDIDQILLLGLRKGKITEEQKKEVLDRITPSNSYEDLKAVNLVIEAVFEDIEIKEKVLNQIQNNIGQDTIIASNTSTLPISELAKSVNNQEKFIGIHFFSPVHKMNLVEIIKGNNTSQKSIAKAFDFVRVIKKTPIIVNDARGFLCKSMHNTIY